jgi:hypothetical protein
MFGATNISDTANKMASDINNEIKNTTSLGIPTLVGFVLIAVAVVIGLVILITVLRAAGQRGTADQAIKVFRDNPKVISDFVAMPTTPPELPPRDLPKTAPALPPRNTSNTPPALPPRNTPITPVKRNQ